MAQRKISILDNASEEVAHVAYFIESQGLPETAKKFVDSTFLFFESLGDSRLKHRPCSFAPWRFVKKEKVNLRFNRLQNYCSGLLNNFQID